VDEYLISLILRGGQLEDIRLDETVDLQRPGVERFLTWRSDRSFRFVIDGRRFEWGAPYITGLKLKEWSRTCALRINTTGSPIDFHRGKKA